MDFNMFDSKPMMNSSQTDSCSSSSQASREQQQPFPEWINKFNKEFVKICGVRCSEKLDEIMEAYIQEIKKEFFLCDSSPNRAALISNRMSKTLVFFYLYYQDIKEFFVISQWNENISQLLLYYCRLELKASHRVHRGKDSDSLVSSRIMNALWIYLNSNYEAMIHVILQIPQIGRRHKDILDPIFRKLLMIKKQKSLTEFEYIRNLLAFKLWKRLYGKEDKKAISHLALTELRPPRSFLANYKKYKFFPACASNVDIHNQFVTGLIDLDSAIKEYLEVFHKKKRIDFLPTETKSFISDFCSSFEGLDSTTDDLTTDLYMLDKIKNENDMGEMEDDDCIIVDDPVSTPAPLVQRVILPDPAEVIDLTADEPETQIDLTESNDVVPIWCKELIKQSEESKVTPPPSPVKVIDEAKIEIVAPRKEVIIAGNEVTLVNNIVAPVKELVTPTEEIVESVRQVTTPVNEEITAVKDIICPKKEIEMPRKEIESPPIEEKIITEDNSVGLTEITSTSHPVEDIAQDVAGSSVFTSESFQEESNENFEHVDSTSNIIEEECEEPTITAFVVERTIEDGIVCSEVISEISETNELETNEDISEQTVSAVSNIEFEQFASQNVSNTLENAIIISHITGKSDNIVDTSRLVSDSDELDEDLIPQISDNNNSETHLLLDKESEGSVSSQNEANDFTSPVMEPMSGRDFANYLAGLDSEMYEEFNKNLEPANGDLYINKKRKIEEHSVRTYTKRTPKFDTVLEPPEPVLPSPEPASPNPEPASEPPKERRVPINGEKFCRFADESTDVWETIYTKTLKLTNKETKLFMPNVMLKKENPKCWIPEFEKYASTDTTESLEPLTPVGGFEYLQKLACSSAKKILERQDYYKEGEENPRARVIRRPIPGGILKNQKLPDVVMQTKTKKRGAGKQATTGVVKKRKTGKRKSTRHPAESSPAPNPVEKNPETTPWRYLDS